MSMSVLEYQEYFFTPELDFFLDIQCKSNLGAG